MRAPVQYEAPGLALQRATTINVSRTGVLIELTHDDVPAGTVRFRLNFAAVDRQTDFPDLICEGRVVRIEPGAAGGWRVAVTIDNYEPVRPAAH